MPELREVFEMTTKQVEPELDSWREQEKRQRKANRNKKIGAFAVAAAIGVAAVLVVVRSAGDGTEKRIAIPPDEPAPPESVPEVDYILELDTGEMTPLPEVIVGGGLSTGAYAISPDGARVAYESLGEDGESQVFIADLNGTDVQQLTHDPRGAGSPDWSPDGTTIAYDAYGDGDVRNIFVIELATEQSTQVTHVRSIDIGAVGAQFSPDGSSIVYDNNRARGWGVWIVPVEGGKSTLLMGGGADDIEAGDGTVSPDGRTLAMGCCGFPTEIWLVGSDGFITADHPYATKNLRQLASDRPSFLLRPRFSPDGTRIAYFNDDTKEVFVVDLATGEATFVADGVSPEWLDDHTLIVEIP